MVKLGLVDSVAGVAVGVAGALITVWLVAALLVLDVVECDRRERHPGIRASSRRLDSALPTVPSAEARLQTMLANADFPNVFASIVAPTIPSSGKAPKLGRTIGCRRARRVQVIKVLAMGCSDTHQGTGFFVAPHLVVTNAHVVAGATSVTVGGVRRRRSRSSIRSTTSRSCGWRRLRTPHP